MKKLTILLITLFSISIYAQKAEVKSASKLLKKGNLTDALTEVNKACKLKDQADDKIKAKIMYVKAQILTELGKKDVDNYEKAVKVINKLNDFEKQIGKERYSKDANKLKPIIINGLYDEGNKLYQAKNYFKAAKSFELISEMKKSNEFEYYAAASYLQAKKWDNSLPLLQDLYKKGYTGIKKIFEVIDKNGKVVSRYENKLQAVVKVKNGKDLEMKESMTKSVRPDIISDILYVLGQKGNDKDAIDFITKAKKEDPNNISLIIGEANYYLKKGDNRKFAAAMEKAVKLDPNNKLYNFNLATAYYQMKKYPESRKYYEKTIQLDPKYIDAYKGIAYLILAPEKGLTDKMNTDEVLNSDALFNKYKNQQKDLYRQALPYLEKVVELDPTDIEALNGLKKMYRDLEMKEKFKEVMNKIKSLK